MHAEQDQLSPAEEGTGLLVLHLCAAETCERECCACAAEEGDDNDDIAATTTALGFEHVRQRVALTVLLKVQAEQDHSLGEVEVVAAVGEKELEAGAWG